MKSYVHAAPIAALLEPLVSSSLLNDNGSSPANRKHPCGVSYRQLRRILAGEQHVVTMELADRIITDVLDDPSLWHLTPGLEACDLYGNPR